MSTAAIAFWLTVLLTALALGPAAWTLGRESWRRRRAARASRRLEAAALVIDASTDEALEPLMASLRAKFDPATIERAIVMQLRRDDDVTRARGARLFSALGLDVTFGLRLQKGVKWSERTHAAEVLGLAGQSSAVPALVAALRDRYEDDASVKIAAAAALARLKDPTAIALLIAELKSTDERSLRNVGEALVAFGALAVLPLLDLLIDASQAGARVWAAQILGKIGDARATDELVTRLYDRDDRLRMAAAEALGEIGDARALQPIVRATLRDPAPHVRALRRVLWLVWKGSARSTSWSPRWRIRITRRGSARSKPSKRFASRTPRRSNRRSATRTRKCDDERRWRSNVLDIWKN